MSDAPEPRLAAADLLPVKAVTLFASGVSYTLREGSVPAGEVERTLTFRTTQINDLLKSLVLLDEAGGVQAATYPSRDPVGRTLQAFAVDVTSNQGRADLLRQLRGAEVRAETSGGEAFTGRIVGVEEQEEWSGEWSRTVQTLALLGDEGLVSLPLEKVKTIRLLDARLDREFREALTVLASGSDDNRRTVTLRFTGDRERTIRVGYVAESPVWKVSYRLVLDDVENDGGNVAAKPYLQGWALVENTSDEDWNDVRLSLVSGRPVSFIQDLYQPLYIPRPTVAPDIQASPYPQTHGGAMEEDSGSYGLHEVLSDAFGEAMPAAAGGMMKRELARSAAAPAYALPAPAPSARLSAAESRQSVASQAQGQGAGELFEYHIGTPVRLPRQQAALIPIVAEDVSGEKLSLYTPHNSDPRFPWNAVRLKNDTALHLKAGPVTVFDGGIYAGDARMEDIPPGDNRLLTYAVDLAVEGEMQAPRNGTTAGMTLSIKRGVLTQTVCQRQKTTYLLKNKAAKARRILVEHPFRNDHKLLEPAEPEERTPNWYRFAVSVAPGKTEKLAVITEQPLVQTVALMDGSLNMLVHLTTGSEAVPGPLQDALGTIIERRRAIGEAEVSRDQKGSETARIAKDQERIRANMASINSDTPLYRRYLDELDRQETRLQSLRDEIDALNTQVQTRTDELRVYLDTLEITS